MSLVFVLGACSKKKQPEGAPSGEPPPWGSVVPVVAPRPGMVWIPAGTLVAGSDLSSIPRVPDAEPAATPMNLSGFYIDMYLSPNEAGSLPLANMTRDEASKLCAAQEKRLCTELELERACKGPDNAVFAYGDEYREDVCGTGKKGDSVIPNGHNNLCVSPFGVHDLQGSIWTWTASDYGRGTTGLVAVRGGNGPHGRLVARCANVRAEKPNAKAPNIGVRCCAGPVNTAKVDIAVDRSGPALRLHRNDTALAQRFTLAISGLATVAEGAYPPETPHHGPSVLDPARFVVERTWSWQPLGNEALVLAGGCASPDAVSTHKACGLFVGREASDKVTILFFVATGPWQPTIGEPSDARILPVQGGDDAGSFRKLVAWEWGRVSIVGTQRSKAGQRWVNER
ncbi:MAG: SUMF1/EgtB/PvdO family nonheme iron enzyme [Polyangiaceae bacterium]